MVKKVLLVLSVVALVLAFGAVNAFAEGDDTPHYTDGRINAYDIMQPVAIYYNVEPVETIDEYGASTWNNEIVGIQLWAIDGDGVGQPALYVPIAAVNQAMASNSNVQIAASNGYSLNWSASGVLWVSAPGGYTFAWEPW